MPGCAGGQPGRNVSDEIFVTCRGNRRSGGCDVYFCGMRAVVDHAENYYGYHQSGQENLHGRGSEQYGAPFDWRGCTITGSVGEVKAKLT